MTSDDQRLLAILQTLEECRAGLQAGGNRDSAHLVTIAILDVKMRLYRIGDLELRAFCDELLAGDGTARLRDPKTTPGRRRQPLLRLVK